MPKKTVYDLLIDAWTHILAVHNTPGIVRGWETTKLLDEINAYLNANHRSDKEIE